MVNNVQWLRNPKDYLLSYVFYLITFCETKTKDCVAWVTGAVKLFCQRAPKQKMDTIVFVFVFLAGFYNRCPTYLFFPNHTSRYVCEDSWEEPLFDHSLVCRSSSPDQNKVWIHKQHCGTGLQHLSKKVFITKALGQQRGVSRTFLTIK